MLAFKIDKLQFKTKILNILYFLFLISLLSRLIADAIEISGDKAWGISEFLINYQGGFIRRGLLGEILFFLTKHSNINVDWTIKIICLISLIFVCSFFVKSFLKKGYTLYILPPCFFCGSLILSGDWVRKDAIMICFLIAILWSWSYFNIKQNRKTTGSILINFLAILIILTHEVFAFFALPILFLLFYNYYKRKGHLKSIIYSLLSLLPTFFAFLLMIVKHGDQQTAQAIWDSWQTLSLKESSEVPLWNSIGAVGWETKWTIEMHLKHNFLTIDNGLISTLYWIVVFPIVYYILTNALSVFKKQANIYTEDDRTILSSIVLFQLLCLLPVICFLSCDYMRVCFYWSTSSFAFFLLIPKKIQKEIFPSWFIRTTQKTNNCLDYLLSPTRDRKSVV